MLSLHKSEELGAEVADLKEPEAEDSVDIPKAECSERGLSAKGSDAKE